MLVCQRDAWSGKVMKSVHTYAWKIVNRLTFDIIALIGIDEMRK